jgi:hypothetical protein
MTAPRRSPNWTVPTAPKGTSDNRAASTAFVTGGGAGPRIVLPGATTFYVATNGSDANDGLTPATAWATFAHAMAVITGQIDFGGQTVTLQAVAGHAAFTSTLNITPWVGGGAFIFDGANGGNTTTNNPCIAVGPGALPGPVTVQNTGVLSASGNNGTGTVSGIQHKGGGKLLLSNVNFGACPFAGLWLSGSGGGSPEVSFIGSSVNTISGNSQFLFFLAAFCTIVLGGDNPNGQTKFATSGARTFSGAVLQAILSFADLGAANWDYSGGALTGTRIVNIQSFVGGGAIP